MRTGSIALIGVATGCVLFQPVSAAQVPQFQEKVLYSFCSQPNCADGLAPFDGLIGAKGTLYGTTLDGGPHEKGGGTVFSIDPTSGAERVIYSFCAKKHCRDGRMPPARLIAVGGTLYGVSMMGGAEGQSGTVFAVNATTGVEKVLHSFCSENNCDDGLYPWGNLIDRKGTLYGTTSFGGPDQAGTVFSVDPKSGAEDVIHAFCSQPDCTDGGIPMASLIDVKGTLYGTTFSGGKADEGTVFALDPDTGAETVLYSFCSQAKCTGGSGPEDGLLDVNGVFYGTTEFGGANGYGEVFSLDPNTGAETVLYSFCVLQYCADGYGPLGGLIDVNGVLYGTTGSGGAHAKGSVFAIDPSSGAETVIYSFCNAQNCSDGSEPQDGLVDVKGALYGTTVSGGSANGGAVFSLTSQARTSR